MSDPATRKVLTRKYFYLFWWYYFAHYHHYKNPTYKMDIMNRADEYRLLIVEPRDHGKSVVWSCAFPLWVALTNPFGKEVEILPGGGFRYERNQEEIISQISCAGDLPEMWIRRHKIELKYNKKLIADWGYQVTENMREGIWQSDHILLRNGAQIYSKGSGAQIRGDHPTVVVVDDLEDRKRSKSPENRKSDRGYFFQDLYGALGPDARMVVVGTFVHNEALLKLLYEKEIKAPPGLEDSPIFNRRWVKFRFSAILPDGSALAPEIWSLEALLLRRAELMEYEPSAWRTEYMNQPESSENPIFPSIWFTRERNGYTWDDQFEFKILPTLKDVVTFIDPAAEEGSGNDFTAITTMAAESFAKRRYPRIYVLKCDVERISFDAQLQLAIDHYEEYKGQMLFEAVQYQSVLADKFKDFCKEKHLAVDVKKIKYKLKKAKNEQVKPMDKESRAHRVTHFFAHNQVFWNYDDAVQDRVIEQLKNFPTGEFDDMVDTVVGCLTRFGEMIRNEKNRQAPIRTKVEYDPETGQPLILTDQTFDYDEY